MTTLHTITSQKETECLWGQCHIFPPTAFHNWTAHLQSCFTQSKLLLVYGCELHPVIASVPEQLIIENNVIHPKEKRNVNLTLILTLS